MSRCKEKSPRTVATLGKGLGAPRGHSCRGKLRERGQMRAKLRIGDMERDLPYDQKPCVMGEKDRLILKGAGHMDERTEKGGVMPAHGAKRGRGLLGKRQ